MRADDTEVQALGCHAAGDCHPLARRCTPARPADSTRPSPRPAAGSAALQVRLARGRTRRYRRPSSPRSQHICAPRWVAEVLTVTLTGTGPAQLRLRSHRRHAPTTRGPDLRQADPVHQPHRLAASPDVIAAYRSQSDIESGFRQLKDLEVISFSPMHHWTDQKIRVHVFYSVLALTIAHLMRREAADAGLHLSVRELLAELAGIEETVLLYHDAHQGRPRAQRMLTDHSDTADNWPGCSASTATHPPDDRPPPT